ncbi:MAG TPA: hypothetical protein VGM77_11130 [Gemmatimonadales bacterium]|jgi:hypothetical protein
MSAFQPAYRMTVYGRGDESTALVPINSTHSDPFQITTLAGLSGFQPYMDWPKGTKSTVTIPQAKLVAGRINVAILDKRLSPSSNYVRWVSAFLSESGRLILFGRKCFIEESTDNGSTWTAYFVGRITNVTLTSGLQYTFEITDSFIDLGRTIFDRLPDVGYCVPELLIPSGLEKTVLGMQGVDPQSLLAKVVAVAPGVGVSFFIINDNHTLRPKPLASGSVTGDVARLSPEFTQIVAATDFATVNIPGLLGTAQVPETPVINPNNQNTVTFYSATDGTLIGTMPLSTYTGTSNNTIISRFTTVQLTGSLSTSAFHDNDQYYVTMKSPKQPFYLAYVHPLQLVMDICDGLYSLPVNGDDSQRITIPYDATGIASLMANVPRIQPGIFRVTETMTIQDVIEQWCLQPYNLGYITRPVGGSTPESQLHFFDLALPSSLDGLPTITQNDIVASALPSWTAVAPIKTFTYTYSSDYYDPMPTVATVDAYLKSKTVSNEILSLDIADVYLPANSLEIKANGVRGSIVASGSNSPSGSQYDKLIEPYANTLASDIATRWVIPGSTTLALSCRRTSTINSLGVGDWTWVTVDKAPNQALNQRGGTRLMQVVNRNETGASVSITLVDGALNNVATAPTLGSLVEATSSLGDAVQLPITLANDGGVTFQILAGGLHESTPLDTDARWRTISVPVINNSTYTAVAQNLLAGATIYGRARTEYLIATSSLPSAWVYSNSSVDLDYLDAPTGLSVTNITSTHAHTFWTCANSSSLVEVLLASPQDQPVESLAILQPGSSAFDLTDLNLLPSPSCSVAIRHRNGYNSVSNSITANFIATGSDAVQLDPPVMFVFIGS